ncbi:1,2-phenylacetyl-CoA epoxidase subunit PaaD [Modicisalibacter sp. 'Wilcox']|uniref:1,2-phenylacetyl-CoA epoxidase subunit PaaD n=1 Tax=Modicisalibacter sp. 'Wilcox' TaxID=2679914 RepID=UPI0013D6AD44|nr:1,2-phenylacetyl-CoA epoxidase subunit PaaD [Modicisalibacter sp. 'Wilcox']
MRMSGNPVSDNPRPAPVFDWPASDLIGTDRRGLPPAGAEGDVDAVRAVLQEVLDPEVPAVSVVELGIVREIAWHAGRLHVGVTPTYSGCPATETIEAQIHEALVIAGYPDPRIERRLSPAWTTDWITDQGREKLRAFGIAPPSGARGRHGEAPVVACPQCGSEHTEPVSEFGSTACKALYRCVSCLEPFDYFKCL